MKNGETTKILEKRVGENVCREAPRVSVVVPAYDVAEFIAETLDSVLAQTFKSYEIILVNDGSPDTEKLETALAPYFKNLIYIKQKNAGAAAARNAAIRAARAELLAFLDGDDIWLPDYLESQIKFLDSQNSDLIYADALLFGGVAGKNATFMQKAPSRGAVTAESLITGDCNIITSGTIARREKILEAGLFDENLPRAGTAEDFDLWMRLAKNGAKLDYQRKVLLKYRVRASGLTGSNVQRAERGIRALEIIGQKYELNESEKQALDRRKELGFAELELEKGKYNLTRENYAEAHQHFSRANEYYRKSKLEIVMWLLKINPKLTRMLFKKFRAADYLFINPPGAVNTLNADAEANGKGN
jgi:glycosyltransferase involved in cell wall biosynthesis